MIIIITRVRKYVVLHANWLLKFTKIRSQNPPRSTPKSTQNPLKIGPGGGQEAPGGPKCASRAPGERKRVPRSAPRALQERPGAPQESPEAPEERPKSAPEQPKIGPRRVREAIQERKCDFLKIALSSTREHDFQGSGRPKMRPRSSQIASRRLSRATLSEKSRSREPVERQVDRLGAPSSLGRPVGWAKWRALVRPCDSDRRPIRIGI